MFVYTGLHYAYGPAEMEEAIPSSAFSQGDLVVYDANSSLSRAPVDGDLSSIDIAGVAAADSIRSFDNKVPFFKAGPDTVFWSVMTPGSEMTAGEEKDFNIDANGRPVLVDTATTARAVVERTTNELIGNDSAVSRALVRLIRHGGAVEHT